MRTQCPSCSGWLYFPSWEQWRAESQTLACQHCRDKFAVAPFQATQFSVRDPSASGGSQGTLRRQYEIVGHKPDNGGLVSLQFERWESASAPLEFSVFEGDTLIAIWALRGKRAPLVAVENERSGQRCCLFSPRNWARKQGAVAALLVVLAPLAFGLEFPERVGRQLLWGGATAPVAAGTAVLMARAASCRERDPQNWQRLRDKQARLARRYALEQRASELATECDQLERQQASVQQLKAGLNPSADSEQADRLELYQRAERSLEAHLRIARELRAGYRDQADRLAYNEELDDLAQGLDEAPQQRLAELERRKAELDSGFEASPLLSEVSDA